LPTAKTVKLFMTTGSLEDAPQKLNPINWRIRAKKKAAPDSASWAKARTSITDAF
jgi:hypothetical protein